MYNWRENGRKPRQSETEKIREFLPMSELTSTGFNKLLDLASVSVVPQGEYLFQAGENDPLSVFLMEGRVGLAGGGNRMLVNAGSETARYALANLKPRKFTGRAFTDVSVLHMESGLLEKLVAWDQTSKGASQGVHVEELDPGEDPEWFLQMLEYKIFTRIPTENIEALVARFEPVEVKAGDTIMEQGEPGGEYFIIRRGTCEVLRKSETGSGPVKIAERKPSEGVGEEALISDKPRDATVRMLTDGLLMKLNKSDFDRYLKSNLVNWVDEREVMSLMQDDAVLVDVRLEEEFKHGTLKDAINVPLYLFRLKAESLDHSKHYIVFCDTGARSATAAFILGAKDISSSMIRGGLNACSRLPMV